MNDDTDAQHILNSKGVVLSRSALFLLNQNLLIGSVFFPGAMIPVHLIINQLFTNEVLDKLWYRPENTNIDLGFAWPRSILLFSGRCHILLHAYSILHSKIALSTR